MADARNLFTLLECAAGYALFEVVAFDEIGSLLDGETVTDLSRFARAVKLKAFTPFETAQEALVNANAIANHEMSETLRNFLELNLPLSSSSSSSSSKKKSKTAPWALGVIDAALATSIQDGMTSKSSIACRSDDTVREVLRGCRMHLTHFVKGLEGGQVERKAQLGLGHAYSRCKVKFNPARSDNMIIQSIALLDQMDKDLNTFAMRIREWYCWHFPELKDLVKDNIMFARAAAYIQDKSTLKEDKLDGLTEIVGDEDVAKAIVAAAKTSMGMDCSPVDMINIINFTQRMVKLAEYRKQLSLYLNNKMSIVAPNLSALIGDTVAARLISKAGSLTNLAKAPASTVQILGAEKALFRALKTKGNTPKYGLIYHSTFIGRAESKNKGRISRYLANKCAIATRIDSFSEEPSRLYGEKLRDQVEERLKFYETGAAPRRNVDVMEEVAKQLKQSTAATNTDVDDDDAMDVEESTKATATKPAPESSKKKSKKDKKRKADADNDDEEMKEEPAKVVVVATPAKETQVVVDDQPSSKKKKKRAKTEESTPDAKPQEREDDDKTPSSSQEAKSDKKKKKSKKDDVAAATPTPKQEEASAEKSDKKKKKKSKKE